MFITSGSTRCCKWRLQVVVLLFGCHPSTCEKDTLFFVFSEVYSRLLKPTFAGSNGVFFNPLYEWSFVLSNVTLIASLLPFSFLSCLKISVVINVMHWNNTVWIILNIDLLWLTYRWVNFVFMAKIPGGSSLIWLPYKYLREGYTPNLMSILS